jgi:hypothetical protein
MEKLKALVNMEMAGDPASERQKTGKALSTALRAAVRSKLIPFNPCLNVLKAAEKLGALWATGT